MIEVEEQSAAPPPEPPVRTLWPLFRKILWSIILLFVVAFGVVGVWLTVNEERMVFHPSREVHEPESLPGYKWSRVNLKARDGVALVGWQMETASGDSTGAWLLYLHGNAGNVMGSYDRCAQFAGLGVNVLVVDYRGYGESEGHPDEEGLYLDGQAMYDYLADVVRVPPHKIIIYGYSLGTAVAIDLALHREAACLILEGAFTSIADRGQAQYPYLPVKLFVKNRFESLKKVGQVTIPKLIIHAASDTMVPLGDGQKIYAAAVPPKSFLLVQGGHGNALKVDRENFLGGMWSFLSNLHTIPVRVNPVQPDRSN